MPPRRQQAKPVVKPVNRSRRSTRQSGRTSNVVPNVYQEMLAEAAVSDLPKFEPSPRPQKRRKLSEDLVKPIVLDQPPPATETLESIAVLTEESTRPQQVIFDDFENSDESDVDFEDIELEPTNDDHLSEPEPPRQETLQLDLSKPVETTLKRTVQRRKPITKVDRDKCLDVHKWHLMSLLLHHLSRNIWCENGQVHAILKPLVSRKTISLLHPKDSLPAFEQNHSFVKGIEELCSIWRNEWRTTVRGLRRAYWDDTVDAMEAFDDAEDPIDFDDFKSAAQTRQGSRDLGAQLFCALLRSVAVDARLVFSVQALPYSGEVKPQVQDSLSKFDYIQAPPQSFGKAKSTPRSSSRKKIIDSAYPVLWVEVLNPATTTWIPVDPLVRNTVNKPKTQFEPPASDVLNSMTYVIAFEDDNTARDVTRRYAQWYNAKTRKNRIENTKGGEEWYQSVISVFKRKFELPRDLIEDDQLVIRAAAEGLPKNVQDFKNHPLFVLERHLRRNEVIEPRREVGKISSGPAKIGKLESVFRRQDVHLCRSADAWYRRGMDVRIGEQPLKRVAPTAKRRDRAPSEDDEDDEETRAGIALYAEYQTQVYEPPPVVNGKIPKNAYGNLDVYVPSMIPPGAVHIMHPMANQAAKVLGMDYADAVTGFNFKGRQGTAVVNGVVVSAQYTAAMIVTIEALENQGTQEVQAERSRIILSIWKHMLTALRIRDKLEQEYGEKMRDEEIEKSSDSDDDSTYQDDKVADDGGGFMLEADETAEKVEEQNVSLQGLKSRFPTTLPDEVVQQPIKIIRSPHKLPNREAVNIAQARDDEMVVESASQYQNNNVTKYEGTIVTETAPEEVGGGFMQKDSHSDNGGGGFMVDDEEEIPNLSAAVYKQEPAEDDLFDDDQDQITTSAHRTAESAVPAISYADSEGEGGGFIQEEDDDNNDMENRHTIENTAKSRQHDNLNTRKRLTLNEDMEAEAEAEPNSETSSLLSHDPAEDDDEPEWLAEAIDE